jgi:hypothetical protein
MRRLEAARAACALLVTLLAALLAACGGAGGASDPALSSNLSVRQTGPTEVVAGTSGVFQAVLTNSGPQPASGVSLVYAVDAGFGAPAITCAAAGGASCPSTLGTTMTVAALPAGGSLAFTVTLPVPDAARGVFRVALRATGGNDPDLLDNVAALAPIVQDPRSGDYAVYATDGARYTLSIDYVARSYRMTGTGVDKTGSFGIAADGTAQSTGTGTGTLRFFRSGPGFVIGGFDFDAGASRPFVAARAFVSEVSALAGEFNIAGVSTSNGSGNSYIGATRITGSNYELCSDPVITSVARCPTASIRPYTVTRSGEDFVATPAAGEALRFRVARVGGADMYLRAEKGTSNGDVFRLGLQPVAASSATAAGTALQGMTSDTGWQTVMSRLTGGAAQGHTIVAQPGASLAFPTLTVAKVVNGPDGLYLGTRASDSASVFALEHPLMTFVVGARNGAMAGRVGVFVP